MNYKKYIKKINREIKKSINKQNKKIKKDTQRAGKINQFISREERVRIPAKRKKEVIKKYNNKCAVCKKKPKGVTLQIHHKNGKNSDNRLYNLELLCPNCHYAKHSKGSKINKIIRKRAKRKNIYL